jgi:hypothetical protein
MIDPNFTGHTKSGTIGGIIVILLDNINSGDIAKTIILAGIGAIVSFIISLILRYCLGRWRK